MIVAPRPNAALSIVVRFLQLQHRGVEKDSGEGRFEPVDELTTPSQSWLRWDEAVEREISFGPLDLESGIPQTLPIHVGAGTDIEHVDGGRLVRTHRALHAQLDVTAERDDGFLRVTLTVRHTATPVDTKDAAIAVSFIGTHLVAEIIDGDFISLLEPPASADNAVARCRHHRCFPVLAGPQGDNALMLVSPIILYDHPEIARKSEGALYDSTEIDEILTLRVMTMTDEEKAARARHRSARCADHRPLRRDVPRGDASPARCAARSAWRRPNPPASFLRSPMASTGGIRWPTTPCARIDAVLVNGVRVSRGSRVRLHPSRRADAQDLFFADKIARVTSVHEDVDGDQHVGVVLEDDPAADLHEWYGRYLYFAPDEVEPLSERNSTCKQ